MYAYDCVRLHMYACVCVHACIKPRKCLYSKQMPRLACDSSSSGNTFFQADIVQAGSITDRREIRVHSSLIQEQVLSNTERKQVRYVKQPLQFQHHTFDQKCPVTNDLS